MYTLVHMLSMTVISSGLLACFIYALGTMSERSRLFNRAAFGIIFVGIIFPFLIVILGILPVRYIEIMDYCANWGGQPGVCTEHHLESFAEVNGFEHCEIGYAGPHPSSLIGRDFWSDQGANLE
jgi:hypothetical protein